ncbi:Rv1355c family protein [Nocardia cyriacigeorgica]|uniref:Rv1355c family protein n=1 Tax=Nocardia cyriacigeorgica TaxID=135487 RepID=A0A6P1D6L1_9NOCA|nr:Rv1355c family protein [Nocardia cyriacigeorgica]NEW45209.1 Rv1355c family protein [Nocardia cyriacigeorgica]NEW50870.1 Rv1355c family protein [Nocardia cyriacigeorgica]NEW55610.1 Rv1355c family protein [Nocardia cyriacigeorgica]
MAGESDRGVEYRPLILDQQHPGDARVLGELRARGDIEFSDLRDLLDREFADLTDPPERVEGRESDRWVYYPWRRRVLGLPGPQTLRAIRLDRNRNKLTRDEQQRLREMSIGVVGQSVGHAVAYTIALEGICGSLRLADFDVLELSNLNRVPAGLFDIGANKAVVTARRIAELDPYLPIEVYRAGVDADSVDEFLSGLSVVVEECDSLDIKLVVREAARRHRIPVVMETSDRGLLDVERYDLEPERLPFHGLLGGVGAGDLRGLSTRDKAPYVVALMGPTELSSRMAASMVEVGETLSSWPQLAGDVMLGGASVTTAIRRIGLGQKLPSGRTRVDLESGVDALAEPTPIDDLDWGDDEREAPAPADPVHRILACAQRAPSGGNVQPWTLHADGDEIRIDLDRSATTAMDIGYRGSAVALGAALYNARVAASAHGVLGAHELVESDDPADAPISAVLRRTGRPADAPAADYPLTLTRETNRRLGDSSPIPADVLAELAAAAAAEGATLRSVTDRDGIDRAADLLAESDRIRYLTPLLHEQLFAELRWAGEDLSIGIDARTLELAPDEKAAMQIGRRADVMAQLHNWSAGAALGDYARDRVRSSSAVVAVTFTDPPGTDERSLAGYVRAGGAVQRVWIQAGRSGLAVQPMSPVFLYSRRHRDSNAISPAYADTLASLQGCFLDLLGVPEHETMALVLRLSYAAAAGVRSRRRQVPGADTRS